MTEDEKAVLAALAGAWNLFLRLPVEHPDDNAEFRAAVHRVQEKVAARPAFRAMRAGQGLPVKRGGDGKP